LASRVPMSEEICVEADSGGHTDRGILSVLFPQMIVRRDEIARRHRYLQNIRIGVAGGIGTPQAAAAAFVMGADFVLTGSINQCTVEAGTSDRVKDLLQELNVQDTAYAPAGDMFELGAKVQVVKRGLFFPARANKLYELYQRHNSLDEIDEKTRTQIQDKYFGRSFEDVWRETREYYGGINPRKLRESESNPKQKMALVFKWYFVHSSRLALEGRPDGLMDYQIHCGPALGAFNEWVKGTELESWQNRRVAEIADKIMRDTATLLNHRFAAFTERPRSTSVSQAV
jgi:trans-AT polyketide synthase, acyltransferase and oxidoreductase domains